MSLGEDDDWIGYPLRWLEYAVSAGLMLYLIATLSGAGTFVLVCFLVASNCCLQFFGWLIETLRSEESVVSTATSSVMTMAWMLFLCQWAVIVVCFALTVQHASVHVPDTVYAIIVVLFFFFVLFGVNQSLWVYGYYDRCTRSPNDAADIGYTALSWSSKTSLTWMIYFGVIRERSD